MTKSDRSGGIRIRSRSGGHPICACAWVATSGPDPNSNTTAAIVATLKATLGFEFINTF